MVVSRVLFLLIRFRVVFQREQMFGLFKWINPVVNGTDFDRMSKKYDQEE